MLRNYYHCFVAGLADLGFDDGKNIASLKEFREELEGILHPADFRLTTILFLPYDNRNLIRFFTNKTDEHDYRGNYSPEDFEEQVQILDSIIKMDDILPAYMVDVIKMWLEAEKEIDLIRAEKMLTEGYFRLVSESNSKFLRLWSEFDLNTGNVLVVKTSMDLDIDASDQIVGMNQLADELKQVSKRRGDFRIPPEPDYVGTVFNIASDNEFLERELKIDMLKWNYAEELVFFEYFSIDFILAYMIRLSIALRWKQLDAERGEQMLKSLVAGLREKHGEDSEAESLQ